VGGIRSLQQREQKHMVDTLVEVVGVGSAPPEQRSHERHAEQQFRNDLGRRRIETSSVWRIKLTS
jgi:hypothetical protein